MEPLQTNMNFEDRVSEFPKRRRLSILSQTPTELVVNVERDEGTITKNGTPLNAVTLNSWQNQIDSANAKADQAVNNSKDTNGTSAISVAKAAMQSAVGANTTANTANTTSSEAKRIAENALQQAIGQTGSKVTVGGNLVANWEANSKQDFCTYVADSQTKFTQLVNSSNWLGYSSVLFEGNFTSYSSITIPSNVVEIRGIKAVIQFTSSSTESTGAIGFGYADKSNNRRMDSITVTCSVSGKPSISAFRNCSNMFNCNAVIGSSSLKNNLRIVNGFLDCDYLNNCSSEVNCVDTTTISSGTWNEARGFLACNFIENCTATVTGGKPTSFYNCNQLVNCKARSIGYDVINSFLNCNMLSGCDGYSEDNGYSYSISAAYNNCNNISNCKGVSKSGGITWTFMNCKRLSNCEALGTSKRAGYGGQGYGYCQTQYTSNCTKGGWCTSALWGGPNTKRSDSTCDY